MEPQAQSPESGPPQAAQEQIEGGQQAPAEVAPAAPTPEVQSGAKESVSQGPTTQLPQVVQPPTIQPVQPTADPKTDDQGVVVNAPPVADDIDVIEKEWVDKAKQIVDKTKEDPHQQNKEVSALKADYLKKRYNKDVKTSGS